VQVHPRAAGDELADDRALDPRVDRGDERAVALAVAARLARRHDPREVGALHGRLGGDPRLRLVLPHVAGEQPAAHRARAADVADERAGVHPGDPGTPWPASQSSQPPSATGASSRLPASRMIAARPQARPDSIAAADTP
jgi:hypothetical protein